MRLFWRVFAANALVLTAATVVLALSPATVSFPIGPVQAGILAAGLLLMLAANVALLRRTFAPFERLVRFVRAVDPLRPGARLALERSSPDLAAVSQAVNEMLERLEKERRESALRQVAAQEDERRRVARELHDEIGQLLTAALLQVDALEGRVPEPLQDSIASMRRTLEDAHGDVRDVATRLRPLALDDLGIDNALRALATAFSRDTGIHVATRLDRETAARLSDAERLAVYRVAQEALTNAARHSGGSEFDVVLERDRDDVVLMVSDDGRGVGEGCEGTGVRGMRERALLIGATLELRPRPGGGTIVELRVPGDLASGWDSPPMVGRPQPNDPEGR